MNKPKAKKRKTKMKEDEGRLVAFANSSMRARKVVKDLVDALQWCSGSDDFSPDGKARGGWEKVCVPALKNASVWLNKE